MNEDKKEDIKETPQVIYAVPQNMATDDSDEIDLRELWNTLMRRKFVVLGVTALVMLASLVYLFTAAPEYESKALIKIGVHDVNQFFESENSLKSYITFKYDIDRNFSTNGVTEKITSVDIPNKNSGYISLTARGTDRTEVEKTLETALEEIIIRHKLLYDSYISNSQAELNQFNEELLNYRDNSLPNIKLRLDSLENLQEVKLKADSRQEASITVEMGYLLNEIIQTKITEIEKIENVLIPNLEKMKINLENKLKIPFLVETNIIGDIFSPDNPVKPNKKMILAVAMVAGLMLGVFLVFFLEFLKPKKKEE